MVRGKDKWQDLPDVVAQLQAEAANPAISRPRIDWPDEPVRADDPRARVQGYHEHEQRLPIPGGAVPPPIPQRRDTGRERVPPAEAPASEQTEWGGLRDYDRLAADPRPDLLVLVQLLADACQRSCGTRYKVIEPLILDANRRIERLLAASDDESWRNQRDALNKQLNSIEDLLASVATVTP